MESVGIRVRALLGDRQNNEHPGAKREKSSPRRNKQQAESGTGGDSVWEETCPLRPGKHETERPPAFGAGSFSSFPEPN